MLQALPPKLTCLLDMFGEVAHGQQCVQCPSLAATATFGTPGMGRPHSGYAHYASRVATSRLKAWKPLLCQFDPHIPARSIYPLLPSAPALSPSLHTAAGLQTVYEVARKRGQRATYQNLRAAVEEASGRRFLVRSLPPTLQPLPLLMLMLLLNNAISLALWPKRSVFCCCGG